MQGNNIQRFKVIPVKFSKGNTSCHHELFLKEHSLQHQEENKPPGRTLFVINIPPYITEECLKVLFSTAGKILSVLFQNNKNNDYSGFKMGHIVFAKREGLLKAMQANNLSLDQSPFKTGLDKWIEDYNNSIEDPIRLSSEIKKFMLNYDSKNKAENKKQTKEVDDEGWTVITKKGRKPGIAHKESVKIKLNDKISEKVKKKELKNFYTFQIKESKMKNLAILRKNYEEAKKKVSLMKTSRKFKPY